jgi:class 3 adenylate cyclase/tetratricopeptide (TPR) repeat protein
MPACPECGEENPDRARFCLACGTALAAPEAPVREERKVVTVLFADLVGFTSTAERLDPEEVRALQAPYWARVRSELERYGGTVEKFIGDAVMALFGAPTAHEDDPERAVRAAITIRDAIGGEDGLQVRVGVTTGEALVALGARPAEGEGMASGDVVNTASRLQSAAPPNGILVDETTYRATERAIEYRELAPVEAKGKTEPIPVWEAQRPRWRFGVDVAQRGPAELVGRREELDLLTDALARARRERASQLVTLVGVPGIGKSRLVYELSREVDADPELIYWRQGRSLPYGEGVTFWALAEMVKSHAGILESDSAGEAEAKLRAVVGELFADAVDVDWVLGHMQPLVGLGGEPEVGGDHRAEVFAAWRKFFEALAERHPLVLVFEDLQWADDGLLDFVDHVVEWASGVPLLCVCTSRPELLERRPDWGGGKRNATTISLSPLSDTETARLFALLLEQSVLPADVQSALLARAGGNPLYAEEYVRMVQERGQTAELPESVQGIIAARLDALPVEEKDLLQDAAVVGKIIWVGALAQIVGLARWTIEERLHALERKEFVRREQHSSVAGETEYAFRHILVRDVAYGQIPRARRAEKHRAAAKWIESLASGRGEEHAELLAHHYLRALEYAGAAGEPTADFSERARKALAEAGDRALALAAAGAAEKFYGAALDLWPEDDPERHEIAVKALEAHWHTTLEMDRDRALEVRDQLLSAGNRGPAAELELLLALVCWYAGDRSRTNEHIRSGLALVADLPPSWPKARVLAQVSRFHMLADESEAAIRVGREALEMAQSLGSVDLQARVLNNIGTARVSAGDPDGVEDLERAIEIAPLGSIEHGRALGNLASVLEKLGQFERAFENVRQSERAARSSGSIVGLRWTHANMISMHYREGSWDDALELAQSFIRDAEEGSPHYMSAEAYAFRSRIRLDRGEEGAEPDVRRSIELARAAGDPQILNPVSIRGAHVLFELGHRDDALDLVGDMIASDAASERRGLPGVEIVEAAWLAVAADRRQTFLDAVGGVPFRTPLMEAALAIVEGSPVRAADVLGALGARPEEAFTRLRSGDPAHVERALAFYRSVGANRYIREGEQLLAASA